MSLTPRDQSYTSRTSLLPRVLKSSDVEQGCILWLPTKIETIASQKQRGDSKEMPVMNLITSQFVPEEKFYKHPILVVSRPADASSSITFLPMTTFKKRTITQRFQGPQAPLQWRKYLAVSPAPTHPIYHQYHDPLYVTLFLENGAPSNRSGYVKIADIYSMDWRDAQPYWRGVNRTSKLSDASFQGLLRAIAQFRPYKPGEQFNPTLQRVITSHPTSDVAARATQSRIPHTHLHIHLPTSPAFPIPRTEHIVEWSPQTARNIRTPRTYLLSGSSPHASEEEPLLPTSSPGSADIASNNPKDVLSWLWDYLRRTRLGIILQFICCR